MENKILIAISTKKENQELDAIEKNISSTIGHVPYEIVFANNPNGVPLTKVYNDFYRQYPNTRYVVFMHDDVDMVTLNWGDKLLSLFEQNPEYGIIGVAGSQSLYGTMRWWTTGLSCRGEVVHRLADGKKFLTKLSEPYSLSEVCCLDGVFFCVDRERCNNWFNEQNYDGFHFYDISYTFTNFISKTSKNGATNLIRLVHHSAGDSNSEAYMMYANIFANEFIDYLPVVDLKIKPENVGLDGKVKE